MRRFFLLAVGLFTAQLMLGALRLPALFSNHMVLQQNAQVPIWGHARAGALVRIQGSWNNKTVEVKADAEGKWKTFLETSDFGGPYEIHLSDGETLVLEDVMLGEVWLCAGQSNMEMPMEGFRSQPVEGGNLAVLKSANPLLRMISVPRKASAFPLNDFEGRWERARPESVARFSAAAYFFGKTLQEFMGVPVGLIEVSWGGSCIQAWMSRASTVDFEDKTIPQNDADIEEPNRTPSALFNGMLHPVIGYGIQGALWYQGETNYAEPDLYADLLPVMVEEWRTLWGLGTFPFYYAQIAPFDYKVFRTDVIHPRHNSAFLRDVQRRAEEVIPNSQMVVLLDLGHPDNIHPPQKQEVGERFALAALGGVYGQRGFQHRGPVVEGFSVQEGVLTLRFKDQRLGIHSRVAEPQLFEIAGGDKRFYRATAVVRSKSILLSHPLVAEPVAVRYAFDDYVEAEIFNNAGLPLSSFRTDDW